VALRADALLDAGEGVEEVVHLVRVDAWSGIGDAQDGHSAVGECCYLDGAVGSVVANGVVDDVGDEPFDQDGISPGGRRL